MTFEDWFKEKYKATYDNPNMESIHQYWKDFHSEVWNAAIQASRDGLDRVEFPGNTESLWFKLDEELRKLLTGC